MSNVVSAVGCSSIPSHIAYVALEQMPAALRRALCECNMDWDAAGELKRFRKYLRLGLTEAMAVRLCQKGLRIADEQEVQEASRAYLEKYKLPLAHVASGVAIFRDSERRGACR